MKKLLALLIITLSSCAPCPEKTIEQVGACNCNGVCRVRYSDQTFGYEGYYPVPGEKVQACNP